jgi:hypothetical protein
MSMAADSFVMIIGSMKSGTTSLYNYLIQHPAICAAAEKEPEFFSQNQGHGFRVENYRDLWDFDERVHRYAIEASTGYTKYPFETGVAERIAELGLQPKFIYCVRHPIDRIISQCRFVNSNPLWGNINPFSEEALALSKYNQQLMQFTNVFPKQDLLILDFEIISNDPQLAANQVFGFLGLNEVELEDTGVYNKTRATGKLETAVKKNFPWAIDLLPVGVKGFVRALSANPTAVPTIELSSTERSRLMDLLRDDIEAFGVNFHFDTGKWGF